MQQQQNMQIAQKRDEIKKNLSSYLNSAFRNYPKSVLKVYENYGQQQNFFC